MKQVFSDVTGLGFATSVMILFSMNCAWALDKPNKNGERNASSQKHKDDKQQQQQQQQQQHSTHPSIVERLKPGDELQGAIKEISSKHKLKAGVIISAVGSLTEASLRFAGANEATRIAGPLEIVSINGTLSDASMHVHLSVSDSKGKTTGGHLMKGCKVYTTVELVILDLSDEWSFERKMNEETKFQELDPKSTSHH